MMNRLLKLLFLLGLCCYELGLCENESNLNSGLMVVNSDKEGPDEHQDKDVKIVNNADFDEKDQEVFQPTSSWQVLLPGQAIPAGLHVRMNLQTGLKEAKLMAGDDGSRYQQAKKPKTKFIKVDRNVLSKQHLQAALKDFRDKFHDEKLEIDASNKDPNSDNGKNFKTLEEIKKELEGSDIFMKKDIEVIMEHMNTLNNSGSSLEELQHALDELEYYVHHIDNARDLDMTGGLDLVIKFMNNSEESLQMRAAHVLGSAVQSNLPVQISAMKYGALPLILRLLSSQEPMAVRRKAIYALSTLVRLFPRGQQGFLQLNGLETLIKLFREPGTGPLRVKAITLLTDLLVEQKSYVKQQLEKDGKDVTEEELAKIPLLKAMVHQGWCQLVASALSETTDNDIREKVLQALDVMIIGCKEELVKADFHSTLLNLRTEWQNEVGHEEFSEYTVVLSQLLNDLISKLS